MVYNKGGKARLLEEVKRKTATRKTKCPFKIAITRRQLPSRDWDLIINNSEHNHPLSGSISAHPMHQKRTKEELDVIKSLSRLHISAKHILLVLKERDPDTAVTIQDLYNERAKLKAEELSELTICEALYLKLWDYGKWATVRDNGDDGHLNQLFFTHFTSIQLVQNYPYVLLINCTYHMNQYNMPLLHFAGISLISEGFSISFTFIAHEIESYYRWALQQFKEFIIGDPLRQGNAMFKSTSLD